MKNKILKISIVFLTTIFSIILGLYSYLKKYIRLDFPGFLYTLTNNINGTANNVYNVALKHILPFFTVGFILSVLYVVVFFDDNLAVKLNISLDKKAIEFDGKRFINAFTGALLFFLLGNVLYSIDKSYGIVNYYKYKNTDTSIYEDCYVDPKNVEISGSDTNNLILIYIESMETSFMSIEEGGFLNYSLIPNLTKLGNENLNFSATEEVGGFNSPVGTTWTIGAIFSSYSGIPFSFPVDGNSMDYFSERFAPRVVTLGDILKDNGYNQEFLCGSDSMFGSRKSFFETHGNYKIYDYFTALDKGEVQDMVWWGFEDSKLYDIAKSEITELYLNEKPFCFTMLTADTHHVGGYVCEKCLDEYEIQYANVVNCADRQIYEFIEWIKAQPFYESTTIVIIGDHPTMDSTLIDSDLGGTNSIEKRYNDTLSNSTSERYVYNCFINSRAEPVNNKNREFTTFDLFPTILSSLGFEIDGNRLGLGVNLYSDLNTLEEEMGYESLNKELSKHSDYYEDNFY